MINLTSIVGFEWDAGNARKKDKHGVSMAEAEQIFFNVPLLCSTTWRTARANFGFMRWDKPMRRACCT